MSHAGISTCYRMAAARVPPVLEDKLSRRGTLVSLCRVEGESGVFEETTR